MLNIINVDCKITSTMYVDLSQGASFTLEEVLDSLLEHEMLEDRFGDYKQELYENIEVTIFNDTISGTLTAKFYLEIR